MAGKFQMQTSGVTQVQIRLLRHNTALEHHHPLDKAWGTALSIFTILPWHPIHSNACPSTPFAPLHLTPFIGVSCEGQAFGLPERRYSNSVCLGAHPLTVLQRKTFGINICTDSNGMKIHTKQNTTHICVINTDKHERSSGLLHLHVIDLGY
jgi:hypothetical protein